MNTPHKHAEVIKAWADNPALEIEFRRLDDCRWAAVQGDPLWSNACEYRIKPERVYPKTLMSYAELRSAFEPKINGWEWDSEAAENIANAAIRHAIDSGQVVVAEEIVKRLGRAETTLAVAGYTDNGGELWKPPLGRSSDQRAARDMAIAKAVRDQIACLVASYSHGARDYCLEQIDLCEIIASVK